MRKYHYFWIVVIVLMALLYFAFSDPKLPYAEALDDTLDIERIAEDVGPVSRIKISPDGELMLVGLVSGEIKAMRRSKNNWVMQDENVFSVQTGFPGFPPKENGLVGIAFSADYPETHEVFVTYAVRVGESDFRNRIGRLEVLEEDGAYRGKNFQDIFEANTSTSSSHQIQDIVSANMGGEDRLLFLIGDGFKGERARDITKEAGKLMSIKYDGSDGKIEAIGLRNSPGLAVNEFDPERRIAIVDTGPDRFDRFLYGNMTNLDFGWDGSEDSLAIDIPDINTDGRPNSVLYRWDPTHTATNVAFHPGKGIISEPTLETTSVLVSLFGRTGESGPDKPGRSIWLGRLWLDGQPTISWKPLIVRSKTGANEIGHPIALEIDPLSRDIIFADIMEGAIYEARIKN